MVIFRRLVEVRTYDIIFNMRENLLMQRSKSEEKIDVFTEEVKRSFSRIFDSVEKQKEIDGVVYMIEQIPDDKINNKEEVINGLKTSVEIKSKKDFINHILKVVEPVHIFSLKNPKLFEDMQREHVLEKEENTRLSKVLFCGFDDKRKSAHIHLAVAREFIKEFGIKAFIREVTDGLRKLAEIIKDNNEVNEVTATSWIVKEHPELMKNLGFTLADKKLELSPSSDDKRKRRDSFISREDFLSKYGNKYNNQSY